MLSRVNGYMSTSKENLQNYFNELLHNKPTCLLSDEKAFNLKAKGVYSKDRVQPRRKVPCESKYHPKNTSTNTTRDKTIPWHQHLKFL